MKRSGLVALALCAGAGAAHADAIGTLPNGAELNFNRLFIHENNSKDLVQPAKVPDSIWHYFNMAHCVCSQAVKAGAVDPNVFHEATYSEELVSTSAGSPPLQQPVNFWVGSGCDQLTTRMMTCHQVTPTGSGAIGAFSQIMTHTGVTPEFYIFDLIEPVVPQTEGCEQKVLSATEYAVMDVGTNGTSDGTDDYFLPISIDTDTQPPPLPTVIHAEGAESAIQLSWDAPVGNVADIAYYQALCATSLGNAALPTHFPPRYISSLQLCGQPSPFVLTPTTVSTSRLAPAGMDAGIDALDASTIDDASTGADGGTLGLPEGLSLLDPNFICGEVDDATATSMRIEGLANGVSYQVVLLAIDKYGNYAGTFFTSLITPQAVTDFWEDLQARGSQVEGGFCLIAETYGDDNPMTDLLRRFRDNTLADTVLGRAVTAAYYATLGKLGAIVHGHWPLRIVSGILLMPLIAVALAWHLLTLPGLIALALLVGFGRRHRRRVIARATAAAALAAVALAPSPAHAQAPYWEQPIGDASTPEPDLSLPPVVDWHAGFRIGPYIPSIDAQFGGPSPGPFQAMFGSKSSWLPMLDFDRTVWHGFGLVMVGIEIGYMSRSAHAWAVCADPTDFACDPSNPDRMRSSGDKTAFHLIPAAATVTYRFTELDDDYGIPVVPYVKGGLAYYAWWITGPNGDVAKVGSNSGAGASLGVVGSLGLAIRAERIDAEAARGMRDSGIQHAGFYGEIQTGKVDGFGSDKKLSVGDTTWFAGVDFEF